jgi:hypothetical protein
MSKWGEEEKWKVAREKKRGRESEGRESGRGCRESGRGAVEKGREGERELKGRVGEQQRGGVGRGDR